MPRPVKLRMAIINRHLVPVKVLLFFICGGYGCLWPFLSVHMRQLGLTIEETAIINLVTPFTSLLGPPLISVLTTKTQRNKLIFSICLIISAFAFTALLFVPPTVRHPLRDPEVVFECGHRGGTVHVERCDHSCVIPTRSPSPSSLTLRNCIYVCDEVVVGDGGGLGEGVPSKPYICSNDGNVTNCQIYNISGYALDIKISVPYMELEESTESCSYPLVRITSGNHVEPLVNCRISQPGCAVRCTGIISTEEPAPELQRLTQEFVMPDLDLGEDQQFDHVDGFDDEPMASPQQTHDDEKLHVHQCQKVDGHPLLTFAAYLILRIVAEFFMYSSLALLESTVTNNMWDYCGFFSQQFIWAIVPIGFLCPLLGLIVDLFAGVVPGMDYAPVFALFDVMMVFTVILLTFLPVKIHGCVNKLGSYIGRISTSGEVLTFFVMMMLMGTVFGFLETFYYWYLRDRGVDHVFLGLTLTVAIFPAIPLLIFGDAIVRKCGHANFIIAAFFAYSLRLLGYSLVVDPRFYFPFEVLKVLSHFLMWVAAVTYCEKLGPKILSTTITGTVGFIHNNIGRGIGALIGGYIMSYFGAVNTFRVMAVYSGIVGLIYMATYHFYLKDRKAPIYIESSSNGHYTPMEQYSNGENQMSKPMLNDKHKY